MNPSLSSFRATAWTATAARIREARRNIAIVDRVAAGLDPMAQSLGRFPAPVWILFLGTFINKFGTFVLPFLGLHVNRLGFSTSQAGLVLGAYGAGHLVASLAGGHFADTFGRRNTIVLSMFTGSCSMMLLSQASGLGWLILLAFLTGLTVELYKPASSALLTDLSEERDRVTIFAAYRLAINAGWSIGPAVAGMLAQQSYLWLFVGDASTSALFGLVALMFLPVIDSSLPNGTSVRRGGDPGLLAALQTAGRDRHFLRILAATFPVLLAFVQMPTTLGLQIKAAGGSDAAYGMVLALNGFTVVLLELPLSSWVARFPSPKAMAAGYALIGLGTSTYAWAHSTCGFALGMLIFTVGEILCMPLAMATVARLAPVELRGRYLGLYGLSWAVALTVGPWIGATVFAWYAPALWIGGGMLGLLAAVIIVGEKY
jgi:MFS family permease